MRQVRHDNAALGPEHVRNAAAASRTELQRKYDDDLLMDEM